MARAQNAQVLDFAQRMVTERSMAIQHARATAAANNLVPAQSTLGQQGRCRTVR